MVTLRRAAVRRRKQSDPGRRRHRRAHGESATTPRVTLAALSRGPRRQRRPPIASLSPRTTAILSRQLLVLYRAKADGNLQFCPTLRIFIRSNPPAMAISKPELACVYAALILADDDIDVTVSIASASLVSRPPPLVPLVPRPGPETTATPATRSGPSHARPRPRTVRSRRFLGPRTCPSFRSTATISRCRGSLPRGRPPRSAAIVATCLRTLVSFVRVSNVPSRCDFSPQQVPRRHFFNRPSEFSRFTDARRLGLYLTRFDLNVLVSRVTGDLNYDQVL